MAIFANRALLATGWADNLRVELEEGCIARLTPNATAQPGDTHVDTLLPALANLHSHAFQRAMAGMTEYRLAGRDSFWTWRDLMYRFTAHLSPEQVQAIAALVYLEMQEAGYASVGEFHYLHHRPDGQPYDRLAELSDRIMEAARRDRNWPDPSAGAVFLCWCRGKSRLNRGRHDLAMTSTVSARWSIRRGTHARPCPATAASASRHTLCAPPRPPIWRRWWPRKAPVDPYPHCRTAQGSGRGPGRSGGPPGGMAAGQCPGRCALVPDPRHPYDRG